MTTTWKGLRAAGAAESGAVSEVSTSRCYRRSAGAATFGRPVLR